MHTTYSDIPGRNVYPINNIHIQVYLGVTVVTAAAATWVGAVGRVEGALQLLRTRYESTHLAQVR